MRRNTTQIASRFRHYIFAKIYMPASEPFISKETVEYTSNCEFLLKIYHFPSFWKSLSSTKFTYTPRLSAIYALTISDRGQGSLNPISSGGNLSNTYQMWPLSLKFIEEQDFRTILRQGYHMLPWQPRFRHHVYSNFDFLKIFLH